MKKIFLILFVILIFFGGYQSNINPYSVKNKFMLMIIEEKVEYKYWGAFLYEVMEITFKDNNFLYVTSNLKTSIKVTAFRLKLLLKRWGYEIKDIKTMIHNHFEVADFSKADIRFLKILQGFGFEGKFKLWCKGKIYEFKY